MTSDYGKDALAYNWGFRVFLSHRLKQTCSKCGAVMLLEWILFMKLLLPDIVIWSQFCSFHQNPILSYPAVSFNHKNPSMVENSTTRPPSWRKMWLKDTADPILSLISYPILNNIKIAHFYDHRGLDHSQVLKTTVSKSNEFINLIIRIISKI